MWRHCVRRGAVQCIVVGVDDDADDDVDVDDEPVTLGRMSWAKSRAALGTSGLAVNARSLPSSATRKPGKCSTKRIAKACASEFFGQADELW